MAWHRNHGSWTYSPSSSEVKPFEVTQERAAELRRLHPGRKGLIANEQRRLWRLARDRGEVKPLTPCPGGVGAPSQVGSRERSVSKRCRDVSAVMEHAAHPPAKVLSPKVRRDKSALSEVPNDPIESSPSAITATLFSSASLLDVPQPMRAFSTDWTKLDRRVKIREAANFESWVWGDVDSFINAIPFITGMLALRENEYQAERASLSMSGHRKSADPTTNS